MDSALLVSHSEKSAANLASVLAEAGIRSVSCVSNAGEARRLFLEKDFDLCVVNAPLPDETGEKLACSIASKGLCEVLLIVKAEFFDAVAAKTEDYGVITVAKPLNKAFLWSALKLAQATHKKLRAMQSQNQKLLNKIEDIRTVDRAKCILISRFSMTEPEAHRAIEKQAMDQRITRREVAEKIIKTYED